MPRIIYIINYFILFLCLMIWILFFTNVYTELTGIQQLNAYYWMYYFGEVL